MKRMIVQFVFGLSCFLAATNTYAQHARCEIISKKAFLSDHSTSFVGPLVRTVDGGFIAHLSVWGSKFNFNCACAFAPNKGSELFQKYNADGTEVEWERCYSDTLSNTKINSILPKVIFPRSGGRFMLVGIADNDTPGYGSGPGLRLEHADHSIVWQHGFGGIGSTLPQAYMATADSGFIFASESYARLGDVGTHIGSPFTPDIFIIKVDSNGHKEWTKNLGGTASDRVRAIAPGPDGGYYITGLTASIDGDFTGNHNKNGQSNDAYIVRLDSNGTTIWTRCFGGSKADYLLDCVADGQGGVLAIGASYSYDGDITDNKGGTSPHLWVLRVNSQGGIIWSRCYGSQVGGEEAKVLCLVSGNSYWIAAGSAGVAREDVDTSYGTWSAWILQTDTLGNIINQRVLGNPIDNTVPGIIAKIPGGVAVGGWYYGQGGNMPDTNWSTYPDANGFFYRLSEHTVSVGTRSQTQALISAYPNPVDGTLYVELNDKTCPSGRIWLSDINGKEALAPREVSAPSKLQLNCASLVPGHYLLHYRSKAGTQQSIKIEIK